MNWLLLILMGLLAGNLFMTIVIFGYVNRNWEKLIDYQNQINQLDRTIYHAYNNRRG